ncbi:APC family permease [Paracoccus sp. S3-43]|uniref:APC family permease n=1 Tax=Paracoccus sp. S3-43 TaxID=3030011 RepID=UPI0023B15406|nr:APC family permease [Paracoccus sp. S3-43]WEF25758.1 APC family permease [Paracoccus sp. S3-43]
MADTYMGAAAPGAHQPELHRVMGPKLLLLFIVGDILGTGVYALTGTVAAEVGGAAWAPFLVAFLVATITAMSYLELVTRYPQAAGAALYAHRAFGVHFLTFLVAFTVMCSGITSASTASNAFAGFLNDGFRLGFAKSSAGILLIALGFMALVAAINLRGVGESVKANVILTCVELTGLLMIIFVGFYAMAQGRADFSEVMVFHSSEEKGAFLSLTAATALAFFAMVGFEDSVNMAEEVKDPVRIFPRIMLTGLGITGVIYILVSICAVALVPVGDLSNPDKGSALTQVVRAGAPNLPFDTIFPFIGMFAVANSALINMLMASRLLYGLARQGVLPHGLGLVHHRRRTPWVAILFTTALAFGLIYFVVTRSELPAVSLLGGTTSLLLLCVFTVVNISLIVLRRQPAGHDHFRAPAITPWIGAVTCAFLAGPWARSAAQMDQYRIAGWLLAIGIVLWAATWIWNRARHKPHPGSLGDIESMREHHGDSPRN